MLYFSDRSSRLLRPPLLSDVPFRQSADDDLAQTTTEQSTCQDIPLRILTRESTVTADNESCHAAGDALPESQQEPDDPEDQGTEAPVLAEPLQTEPNDDDESNTSIPKTSNVDKR